jgi:hypothetical protein
LRLPAFYLRGKPTVLTIVKRLLLGLACTGFYWTANAATGAQWESPDQLWQVGSRRWDATEEQRFADWVEKTVNQDFFIKYGIAVDCADVPYGVRWIYARINHLPAAATTVEGDFFGHWSTDYAHLPTAQDWDRDQRFRAALLHVLGTTYTGTLPADTYPIRISADSVQPGSVFLTDGHAGMVGHLVLDGSMASPVQTWEAMLPRKVRKLWQKNYVTVSANRDAGTGLLRFRWPVYSGSRWTYLPSRQQPYFSDEQYRPDFRRAGEVFDEAVARRIDPPPYDPAQRADKTIDSLYRQFMQRVQVVQDGLRHCRRTTCPEDSYLWEMYSTPDLDESIAFEIDHLKKLIKDNGLDEVALEKTMDGIAVPIDAKKTVSLNYLVQNHVWLAHDPGDPIEARWALDRCTMIRSRIEGSLRDLNFVEQTYRAKDPDFAERGRKSHLQDLTWLQKEGKRAECNDLPAIPVSDPVPSASTVARAGT